MPGCIVSGLDLYNHMTAPQQTAAKRVNKLESGGIGRPGCFLSDGTTERGMRAATTREHTYRTICSLTADLFPNTR